MSALFWLALLACTPERARTELAMLREEASRHHGVDPDRFEAVRRRLRLRHWAPDVSTRFGLNGGASESERMAAAAPASSVLEARREGYGFEARFEWRLSELIFDLAEVSVLRETTRAGRFRQELLARLHDDYFEGCAVRAELGLTPSQRLHRRLVEIDESLDALTAGAWSRLRGRRQQ